MNLVSIEEATIVLKEGNTLLYPTDTIWGIGCDATNESACQKILSLKKRPEDKSFIILVDGFTMLERIVPDFHPVCYDLIDLADKPLTIIYPSAKGLAPAVLGKDGSIAIRVTKDPSCLKLIRSLRQPIVSSSANLSGKANPTCFNEIDSEIKEGVDAVLNWRLNETMTSPSQIIKIDLTGGVKVIRS